MNMYCRNAKKQVKCIMKAFIEYQFGYCPLVWLFCGKHINARINHNKSYTLNGTESGL